MRLILILTSVAALFYSGYWIAGSTALERGLAATLAEMQAAGSLDYADYSVRGFPNRFDVTIDAPVLHGPDDSTEWRAAFVQFFALAYRPNELIAVLPPQQDFRLGGQDFRLTSSGFRASLRVSANTDLALQETVVNARELSLTGAGAAHALTEFRFATRLSGTDPLAHDLGLDLIAFTPDPALRALIDPDARLPAVLDRVHLDATLRLDRAIDRHLGGGPEAQLTAVGLRDLSVTWGKLRLFAAGDLQMTPSGTPEGRIAITATNWREALTLAVAAGALSADQGAMLERGLAAVARPGPDGETVELPLLFDGGQMRLGPFPLGPAPRF